MPYPFTTAMRLDVEDPSLLGAGQAANLIRNPDGDLGGWGWITPEAGTIFTTVSAGTRLTYLSTASAGSYFHSEAAPATAGVAYTANWLHRESAWHRGTVQFLNAAGAVIGSSSSAIVSNSSTSTDQSTSISNVTAPAGTLQVRLRVELFSDSAGTPPTGSGFVRVMLRAKLGAATTAANVVEPRYSNLMSPATSIDVDRTPLNVGTLTASIPDATYDPSLNALLRPGRRCRLVAIAAGVDQVIFTGKIDAAAVKYAPLRSDKKRARITLTAVDSIADLANVSRPDGVASLSALRQLLEGAGVPWRINGDMNQAGGAPVVSRNESASVIDQVAITRDSLQAFAWLRRDGVLCVNDAATMSAATAATLTESAYGDDIDVAFNVDQVINIVTIRLRRFNAANGQTVEIPYGPYRHEKSIAEWGPRSAEFTIHGLADTPAAMAAYADQVLAKAAVPTIRANSLTFRVAGTADVSTSRALLEHYDKVRVTNANTGLDQTARVSSIRHRITPRDWLVDLGFERDGGVASPQITPALVSQPTITPGPTLQNGQATFGTFGAINTVQSVGVVFPVPFATVPRVFAVVRSSAANTFTAVTVSGQTVNGCTLNLARTSSTAGVGVDWLAVV